MPTRFLRAVSLLALAPSFAQQSCAQQDDDVVKLVPPETAILVRFESARGWNELVHAFAPLAGEDAAQFDLQKVLDDAAVERLEPGALPRIDAARPLYVAVAFDAAGGPGATFLVPTTNAKAFQLDDMGASVVQGRYSAFSNRKTIPVGTGVSPLLARLQPGLVSARFDLAKIIATFRPLIDTGLRQAEMELDQLPTEGPFDVQPLFEAYLGYARKLLDSARSLDFALERDGDELALRFVYEDDSARPDPGALADLAPLLGALDPASPLQMTFNGTLSQYFAGIEGILEAMLSVYPEPLRTDLRRLFDAQQELEPLMAPGLALSADLGPDGMHGAYVLRSPHPEELLAKLEALIRSLDHSLDQTGGFVTIGPVEARVVDGFEVRTLPLTMHYESLLKMITSGQEESEIDPALLQQVEQSMAVVYGSDQRLTLTHRDALVFVTFGNGDARLDADLARLRTPVAPGPERLRLLHRIEPGALGFTYHVDFGRTFAKVFEAVSRVLPGPLSDFPFADAVFDAWGSVRGGSWTAGVALSLSELLEFARSVQTLEAK